MSELFQGDVSEISGVNIDEPLAKASYPYCDWYWVIYDAAANKAGKTKNLAAQAVYGFLSQIIRVHPNFDIPQPFGPDLSNLNPADAQALRTIADLTREPSLRSRLFDLLWQQRPRIPLDCERAAKSYFEGALKLEGLGQNSFTPQEAIHAYRRGLQVAAMLGKKKPLFKDAIENIKIKIRAITKGATPKDCWPYMDMLAEAEIDGVHEFAVIAERIARRGEKEREFYDVLKFWRLAAEFHRQEKNIPKMKAAKLREAGSHAMYAEDFAKAANFSAAAGNQVQAIEALQRAGASAGRIRKEKLRLSEYQKKSSALFATLKGGAGIEISAMAAASKNFVKRATLRESILALATVHPLSDPKSVRAEAINSAKKRTLSRFFGSAYQDDMGRLTAQHQPLLSSSGAINEEALQAEIFARASRTDWRLRAHAYINPGRHKILEEYFPAIEDLKFLVENNPFVPTGHEGSILRGLHAGLHGDFLTASLFLVPQIENSVRHYLSTNGVVTTVMGPGGIEDVKLWGDKGGLLGLAEFKHLFGLEIEFELRGHLVEKTGYNFRNRIAHGMVSEGECFSDAGLSIWWLVLRLCAAPFFHELRKTKASKKKAPKVNTSKKKAKQKRKSS